MKIFLSVILFSFLYSCTKVEPDFGQLISGEYVFTLYQIDSTVYYNGISDHKIVLKRKAKDEVETRIFFDGELSSKFKNATITCDNGIYSYQVDYDNVKINGSIKDKTLKLNLPYTNRPKIYLEAYKVK